MNPGSIEAQKKGCTCPVIDNHYGKGFTYGSEHPCFYIQGDCPIHALNKGKKDGLSKD